MEYTSHNGCDMSVYDFQRYDAHPIYIQNDFNLAQRLMCGDENKIWVQSSGEKFS